MVCLKHVNEAEGAVSRSVGSYSGDTWLTANARRSFSPHSSFSSPHAKLHENSHAFFHLVNGWFLLRCLTSCPPISLEHVWAYCGMLCLYEGCCSCLSNSSALLCLSVRMVFPSAAKSSGVPAHPLQCCTSPFAEDQQRWPSQEAQPSHIPFPLSPYKNTGAPSRYQQPFRRAQVSGKLKIIAPINHPWALG